MQSRGITSVSGLAFIGPRVDVHAGLPSIAWTRKGFVPDPEVSDGELPDSWASCWKAPTSSGSTGVPNVVRHWLGLSGVQPATLSDRTMYPVPKGRRGEVFEGAARPASWCDHRPRGVAT